jgi:hypothetical protein
MILSQIAFKLLSVALRDFTYTVSWFVINVILSTVFDLTKDYFDTGMYETSDI